MNTHILQPDQPGIARAAQALRDGELVAFPTETVYGLGADAGSQAAVEAIFAAKGRPGDNPLIVHLADSGQAEGIVTGVDARARALMDAFWPGPLTLVLRAWGGDAGPICPAVTAGLETVGIRVPSHPVARALLRAAGIPVAAPSANRSGRPSPTRAQHVWEDMNGRIPLILDGGACEVGLESTVLDMTGPVPVVLRPGGVTPEMIERVAGAVRVDGSALAPLAEGVRAASPGMKYKHYAPDARVLIVAGDADGRAGRVRALREQAVARGETVLVLAPPERLGAYAPGEALAFDAATLFGRLREADAAGARLVLAEALEAKGIGLAVMNRLCRAAGFEMLEE